LYVGGSSSGSFTLDNLRLHYAPSKFSVKDTRLPTIIRMEPRPGSGNATHPIYADDEVYFEFDRPMRPGTGNISITSTFGVTSLVIGSNEVLFNTSRVSLDPAAGMPDSLESTITMGEGVVRSLGSWNRLLLDYEPQVASRTGPCEVFSSSFDVEAKCYINCRQLETCVAFKAGLSGANEARCCLYKTFTLAAGAVGGVTHAPGEIFGSLVADDSGVDYGGIEGPDATIEGFISVSGFDAAEFWSEPKIVEALKATIAYFCVIPGVTIHPANITISNLDVTTTTRRVSSNMRRLLSTTVGADWVVTLTPDQAGAAQAVSAALASVLVNDMDTFLSHWVSELTTLGYGLAPSQQISFTASNPTVVQGTGIFSFLVTDSTGPVVTGFQPANGASEVEPGAMIVLSFTEGIQKGTGSINFQVEPLDENHPTRTYSIDVDSDQVSVNSNSIVIRPRYYLQSGVIKFGMAQGVVKDDPHEGTLVPNMSPEIPLGDYSFSVRAQRVHADPGFVALGASQGKCHYAVTYYQCESFEECSLYLKPVGKCGESPAETVRQVTYSAQQKIAQAAFAHNGGDGRGTLLSYSGGQKWPEFGVADIM